MAQHRPAPRIQLDWTRLLGFDQVGGDGCVTATADLADRRLALLSAKVGVKVGTKPPPNPFRPSRAK